ncbi:MAG: RadC family protein [Clostridia bacterium]|nr:RadC family protein [Clostridia bacterium]
MSGTHDGHRERMRQRIRQAGLRSLQPHEVLEYFLYSFIPRRNTNDIAHELLARFHSLSGVLEAPYEHLLEVPGMTANAALFLTQLPEISSLYKISKGRRVNFANAPHEIAEYACRLIGHQPEEVFAVFCLDAKGNLLHTIEKSIGAADAVNINVRTLMREVVASRAINVVVAHNHPSGDVHPSDNDIKFTRRLLVAMNVLNITLLDSLVVSEFEAYSVLSLVDKSAPKPTPTEHGKTGTLSEDETTADVGDEGLFGAGDSVWEDFFYLLHNPPQ